MSFIRCSLPYHQCHNYFQTTQNSLVTRAKFGQFRLYRIFIGEQFISKKTMYKLVTDGRYATLKRFAGEIILYGIHHFPQLTRAFDK